MLPPSSKQLEGVLSRKSEREMVSLDQLVNSQFPALSPMMNSEASRRKFLQLMGASLGLAGMSGCRWPREKIVPHVDRPDGRSPGVPVQFATAMELAGVATGLLVTSVDGRPIKVEGNSLHPFSRGKTNAWQQASVLELYDPDRSMHLIERTDDGETQRTWDDFAAFVTSNFFELKKRKGRGFAVLTESTSSPSVADMKSRVLAAFPKTKWYEHEPISFDNEREGLRLATGKPLRAHLHLDKAKVILSLDSDFLMTHPAAVKHAGDFAMGRRGNNNELSRLYVVESNLSVTGGMADHRIALCSSEIADFAKSLTSSFGIDHFSSRSRGAAEAAEKIAADLQSHGTECLVIVGNRQPPEIHALAHLLNSHLGSVGNTVSYTEVQDEDRHTHNQAIGKLTEELNGGEVTMLLMLGGNPAQSAPANIEFTTALAKVETTLHLSHYDNETSKHCKWHLPRAHFLESWGDARAFDGALSIVQPLIAPLYGGKTVSELLALAIGDELNTSHEITKRTFSELLTSQQFGPAAIESHWKQTLHDGIVPDSVPTVTTQWTGSSGKSKQVTEAVRALPSGATGEKPTESLFEINFVEDYSVFDGRFANNAWLQELPDPITKLTWDNAALISQVDADRLGINRPGDVIRIEAGSRTLEIAAYPVAGHAEGSITLPLGYGRTSGVIALNSGVNAATLLPEDGGSWITGAKVTRTGRSYPLAMSQDSPATRSEIGAEESARRVAEQLVKVATLDEFRQHPDFAKHEVHSQPLWQDWSYEDGHKWGMAVDLSACIGCSGCVIACQAENNIPVVGKQEVAAGREMHWLRIDRYFQERQVDDQKPESSVSSVADSLGHHAAESHTSVSDIRVLHQPMTCHHCETAPCEQVCPVAATMHDAEGLNVMVYSRCIGTRYCNNNCPFKVRRFNWFWNQHGPHHPRSGEELTEIEKMAHNPEVTIRSRGVMEKCTFCTQRINAVKIQAKNDQWDHVPDGMITPACAQACPTDAIVFGDLNDPNSRVRQLHEDNRSYELLPELNLKSRLLYLARLTNPNKKQA